jgi:hypothetical protein
MRKWVLIFMLLTNVIVFFGFVMLAEKSVSEVDVEIEQANTLRLVSELTENDLQKRTEQKVPDVGRQVLAACYFYEGFVGEAVADNVAGFMITQGLSPTILVRPPEREKYQIVLSLPDTMREKLLLVTPLRESGVLVIPARDFVDSEFVIAELLTRDEAEEKLNGLLMLAQRIKIKHLPAMGTRHSIRISEDIGRNLINKINDVVRKKYKLIKIVKKPCKGVARLKARE